MGYVVHSIHPMDHSSTTTLSDKKTKQVEHQLNAIYCHSNIHHYGLQSLPVGREKLEAAQRQQLWQAAMPPEFWVRRIP
eukprot:scaffold138504_cov41-Prasinocladus_malaysianus.AAC.1